MFVRVLLQLHFGVVADRFFLLQQPPQPFYGPFSWTIRVSQCQKRTSGLYGARED